MINDVHYSYQYVMNNWTSKSLLLEQVIDYSTSIITALPTQCTNFLQSAQLTVPYQVRRWVWLRNYYQYNLIIRSDRYVGGAGIMALLHIVMIAGGDQTNVVPAI